MTRRASDSAWMDAKKDRQLVLRLPAALLEAVEAHRAKLQAAAPYERVTLAHAVRDLLAKALRPRPKR